MSNCALYIISAFIIIICKPSSSQHRSAMGIQRMRLASSRIHILYTKHAHKPDNMRMLCAVDVCSSCLVCCSRALCSLACVCVNGPFSLRCTRMRTPFAGENLWDGGFACVCVCLPHVDVVVCVCTSAPALSVGVDLIQLINWGAIDDCAVKIVVSVLVSPPNCLRLYFKTHTHTHTRICAALDRVRRLP